MMSLRKMCQPILTTSEILFNVISDLFEKEEVTNPHSLENFDVIAAKITDDVLMLRIRFPEPEEEPLCYCSYFLFDENFEKISYFCIGKGNAESGGYPFVCSLTPVEVHHNHDNGSFDDYNDFIRCAYIHSHGARIWIEAQR